MKLKEFFKSPVFLFFAAAAVFWVIYCLFLSFDAVWIFWVYLGLFAALALSYVLLTHGYLNTPLSKEPPPTQNPDEYRAFYEKITRRQQKAKWIPVLCLALLFVFVIDVIDLYFLNGIFNK